ncbi:MAG: hypothetical protein JNN00_15605 [Chitinophagaceae bacterium]|nr:hypothetical protein [Chitinophagaceae bacterium]
MEEDLSYYLFRDKDLYLAPICLAVMYIFAFMMYKRYKGSPLQRYILPALTIRFLCAFLYTWVIGYYYGFGDSHNYYQGVLDMHRAVENDISNLGEIYSKLKLDPSDNIYTYFRYDPIGITHYYMMEVRNYTVSRFGLPLSLIFDRSFICISFCISFFSFLGSWRLLLMFYEMYPHLYKKIAYATLFLPSLLFWGVSLLKDPICVGAMGYFTYAAYSVFIKQRKIAVSLIIMYLSGFLLFNTKPYILICLSAVFLVWIFFRVRDRIEDKTLRGVSTILFLLLAMGGGFFVIEGLAQSEVTAQFSTDQLLNTVQKQQSTFSSNTAAAEGGGSTFNVGQTGGSVLGAISLFPIGVVSTFFRPFPWDVRSPMMILSALEAFAFLALTVMCFRRVGITQTFKMIFSDPVIAFCFVFAILFGGIIGATTTNFGALVRYKLPCIPFYALAFILVMDKSGKFSPKYIFSKKLF